MTMCATDISRLSSTGKNEEVIILQRKFLEDILQAYHFKPEILPEEDGTVTAVLNELDIVINATSMEAVLDKLVNELKLMHRIIWTRVSFS